MDFNLSNIVMACCGFGFVCCGSIFLVLFLIVRVTGRGIIMPLVGSLGGMLMGNDGSDDAEKLERRATNIRSNAQSSLQNKIQAARQDFDSALGNRAASAQSAAPQQSQAWPNDPLAPPASNRPTMQNDPLAPPTSGSESRPSRRIPGESPLRNYPAFPGEEPGTDDFESFDVPGLRTIRPNRDSRRRESHEDEIFGGMLDDEGDGFPDF